MKGEREKKRNSFCSEREDSLKAYLKKDFNFS